MYDNAIRGLESPVTTAVLPQNCPTCDTPIEGVDAHAPSDQRLAPCGCAAAFGPTPTSEPQPIADGGVSWFDLTGFQGELLIQIYELDQPSGQAIRRALESEHDEQVNHGQLYPNLDALVDYGLIEKGKQDRRANYYEATPGGRTLVEHRAQRFASATSRVATDGGYDE
jgi:DNA-binding PadR family transcriptional regulator